MTIFAYQKHCLSSLFSFSWFEKSGDAPLLQITAVKITLYWQNGLTKLAKRIKSSFVLLIDALQQFSKSREDYTVLKKSQKTHSILRKLT